MFLTSWHTDGSSFLSSSSPDSLAICKNILTAAKENRANISAVEATTSDKDTGLNDSNLSRKLLYGDNYCTNGAKCLKTLTLDDIYTICAEHVKGGKAVFQLMWRRH